MGTDEKTDAITDNAEKVVLTQTENGNNPKRPPESDGKKVSFKTRLKNRDFRRKCLHTIWYGASFWALGFVISQRGPAFLDLQIITRTDVEAASFFFTSSSIGYLVGSLVAGMVYDKLNKSLLLLLYLMGMSVTTIVTPWCSIYGVMIAIHFIFSLFGGGLETVGNAEMIRAWGLEGEMAMQFVHFAYAFGGVIAPLVTEPFLTPNPDDDDDVVTKNTTSSPVSVDNIADLPSSVDSATSSFLTADRDNKTFFWVENSGSSVSTFNSASNLQNTSIVNMNMTDKVSELWNVTLENMNMADNLTSHSLPVTTRVHYAYLISGCIILSIMIPVTVQLFTDRSQKRRQTDKDDKRDIKQPLPLHLFLFVLFHLCVFNFLSVSIEDTFASYLSTFVVKHLDWSKSWGAQVTSLYWAMFAAFRFFSIFLVHVLGSVKLLTVTCSGLAISMLVFLLCSHHDISMGVWASSALVGITLAAIFPTSFSWMEEELVRVTGRVASSITIAASAGSMTSPILLGFLMQQLTPMWFSYLMFGEAAMCMAVFLFLLALSRLYLRKHFNMQKRSRTQKEITVPSCHEDAETGEDSTV